MSGSSPASEFARGGSGPERRWGRALVCIALAALAAVLPMLWLGTPDGHDFPYHLQSWIDGAQQWQQGVWLPRWATLAGFGVGQPSFTFYPPLSRTLGGWLLLLAPVNAAYPLYTLIILFGAGAAMFALARRWLGPDAVVASLMGYSGHSWVVTDFRLRANGFERMLVLLADDTTETRAGRISQRLLEIETYRLMALRGLPVAKRLGPELSQAESALANITLQLENKAASDQELLDALVALAARIERATSEHMFRFSATRAYDGLVAQRIAELREQTIPGTQTVGEFMQRRLSPAIATVAATSQRLVALSDRVAHTSALLRTRVDIATEEQNRQLLEKLTRGQAMQLRLQSTVEGLSIAAISYYVISLTHYGSVALKEAGLPVNPEIAAGALIPLVLWAVWRTIKRIHATLHAEPH